MLLTTPKRAIAPVFHAPTPYPLPEPLHQATPPTDSITVCPSARQSLAHDDVDNAARHVDKFLHLLAIHKLGHLLIAKRQLPRLFLIGILGELDVATHLAVDLPRRGPSSQSEAIDSSEWVSV